MVQDEAMALADALAPERAAGCGIQRGDVAIDTGDEDLAVGIRRRDARTADAGAAGRMRIPQLLYVERGRDLRQWRGRLDVFLLGVVEPALDGGATAHRHGQRQHDRDALHELFFSAPARLSSFICTKPRLPAFASRWVSASV